MSPPRTFAATIDNLVTSYVGFLSQLSWLTPMIAKLHACPPDEPARLKEFRAAALVLCARMVPPLKQIRNAVDAQLAAIAGTWEPPKN